MAPSRYHSAVQPSGGVYQLPGVRTGASGGVLSTFGRPLWNYIATILNMGMSKGPLAISCVVVVVKPCVRTLRSSEVDLRIMWCPCGHRSQCVQRNSDLRRIHEYVMPSNGPAWVIFYPLYFGFIAYGNSAKKTHLFFKL